MPTPSSHRDLLLDAMRTLALRKGFAAATVDEVCSAAGVTKGSFYHHFATKEALGLATLQSYFDRLDGKTDLSPVVEAIIAAANDPEPRARYLVGSGTADHPLRASVV